MSLDLLLFSHEIFSFIVVLIPEFIVLYMIPFFSIGEYCGNLSISLLVDIGGVFVFSGGSGADILGAFGVLLLEHDVLSFTVSDVNTVAAIVFCKILFFDISERVGVFNVVVFDFVVGGTKDDLTNDNLLDIKPSLLPVVSSSIAMVLFTVELSIDRRELDTRIWNDPAGGLGFVYGDNFTFFVIVRLSLILSLFMYCCSFPL